MAPLLVLARPPFKELGVTLARRLNAPVKLRRTVIKPSVVQPFTRICIETVVSVESLDGFRVTGAPDAKGADADLYPGPGFLYLRVHALQKTVDVIAPPVRTGHLALVTLPAGIIREVQ